MKQDIKEDMDLFWKFSNRYSGSGLTECIWPEIEGKLHHPATMLRFAQNVFYNAKWARGLEGTFEDVYARMVEENEGN